MATTISVDYEHNCETWWNAARQAGNPPTCVSLLAVGGADSVTVSDEDAREFIAWASAIEGWNENPFVIAPDPYVPHIERHRYETSDGENAVEIRWEGESVEYATFTRGTAEALYRGPSLEGARASLELDSDTWHSLLMSDDLKSL